MKKEDLVNLTKEELLEKQRTYKTLVWIFIPLILGLLYFEITGYQAGSILLPISIITICAIGGLVSILPDLKKLKEEINSRL